MAGGIWALSLDGREIACSSSERDIFGHCPSVRDSRIGGALMLGGGVAAATLGGFWLYLGSGSGGGPRETPGARAGVALYARGAF